MVTGVDHLRSDAIAVAGRRELQLLQIEAEVVQTADAAGNVTADVASRKLVLERHLVPQLLVAPYDIVRDGLRIDATVQKAARLQVEHLAKDVHSRDVEILGALPV